MNEDLLHYAWKYRLFDHSGLQTTTGEPITISQPGLHNQHAGPDFENARLTVGAQEWAGNVEMHLRSSDWKRHGHQHDAAYNNVVLHVVLHHDDDHVALQNGSASPPTLELHNRLPHGLVARYQSFLSNGQWIPCERLFPDVEDIVKYSWLDRVLVDRLEAKSNRMRETVQHSNSDWASTFYQHLCRNFGFKINAQPMEQLAQLLPLKVLRAHHRNLVQVEALLFGTAGMLQQTFGDDYACTLAKEYQFLAKKYRLKSLPTVSWKFARMRPANFPTVRLAQLAALLHQQPDLFATVRSTNNAEALLKLFSGLRVSDYWETHYRFDLPTSRQRKRFGVASARNLLINTVAPMLFLYGVERQQDSLRDRAVTLLEVLPAEQNSIIKKWRECGLKVDSAARSQAALHLREHYCSRKKCLSCRIGNQLLKKPIAHD